MDVHFQKEDGLKGRMIDICQSCSEEAEIAAHGLCYRCYRRVERQAAYDKSGWNPGDTRRQKRLARAHGKMIEALLDFGAGTHPNAERLVKILAAELLPLAEFLGQDMGDEQQAGARVHAAPSLPSEELAPAESERFGDARVRSSDPKPGVEREGDDKDAGVNRDGRSRSRETGDTSGDELGALPGTEAGVGEEIAGSSPAAILGKYPALEENVNSGQARSRSQGLPGGIEDPLEVGRGDDPDRAPVCVVSRDCAKGDAVDYGAFRSAAAAGSGNGGGRKARRKGACGKAAVPEREPHGAHGLETTETASARRTDEGAKRVSADVDNPCDEGRAPHVDLVFGSVCSGIEAASAAWGGLGWKAAWFSEVDPFCNEVLAQRYPGVPNLGDMKKIAGDPRFRETHVDLIVGGTPCPAFSMGGLRKGFNEERGKLTLDFINILKERQPEWFVWENVPGVLSSDKGRTFGTILGRLAGCGYGFAYRVLDSQNFGLPQSRRRVFVVGRIGDWAGPQRVLFDGCAPGGDPAGGGAKERRIPALTTRSAGNANARGVVVVECAGGVNWAVPPLSEGRQWRARALTPSEEERRQGFPGDHTAIEWKGKPAPDALRYKVIGNSMAVPVMRCLGGRIQEVAGQIRRGVFEPLDLRAG